ncbi:MAG: hypothetical protein CFE35_16455 [Novosphingobium sp. PASSN1]|nr:MAG: hypothetical protein CFE35_16455 [Novosphingobium sp. PASSN1]
MTGLNLVVPSMLDTDTLGSFDGRLARTGTAIDTAIAKARLGFAASGQSLALASEGSFGPHPRLPLLAAGIEVLVFIDAERELTLTETLFVERTNFGHRDVPETAALGDWLTRVGFPGHALMVRPLGGAVIAKGIQDAATLARAVAEAVALSPDRRARVETDMRAHLNPTRMASIRRLGIRLARRIATPCPACAAPGWGQSGVTRGLPCADCGTATEMIAGIEFRCTACGHAETLSRPDGLTHAPPGYCPACNP